MDAVGETITDGRMVTRELADWVAGLEPVMCPTKCSTRRAGRSPTSWGSACSSGAEALGPEHRGLLRQGRRRQPEATIIATGERTLARAAALANGTMALGFEFADFGSGSRPYPFAVTAPLAIAESRHRSGEQLATRDRARATR